LSVNDSHLHLFDARIPTKFADILNNVTSPEIHELDDDMKS